MASINYYPAHNPTTSYQCSVPAEVMKRPGEYEYCLAIFSSFSKENIDGTQKDTSNVNLLLESKYPIYVSESELRSGGTCKDLWFYVEKKESNVKLVPISGSIIGKFYSYYRGNTFKGTITMNFKGKDVVSQSMPTVIGYNEGYTAGPWIFLEGSVSAFPSGGVYRSTFTFKNQNSGESYHNDIWYYAIVLDGSSGAYIPAFLDNEMTSDLDGTEKHDYSIGYLNNPRFSSKEEWQAFCENMFNGGA